jgi:excisionase family DNA binding protein
MADTTTPPVSLDRLAWRIAEWAKLTNISRRTLWRMARRGDLKLTYIGNTALVPRSEAIRLGFIADNRTA